MNEMTGTERSIHRINSINGTGSIDSIDSIDTIDSTVLLRQNRKNLQPLRTTKRLKTLQAQEGSAGRAKRPGHLAGKVSRFCSMFGICLAVFLFAGLFFFARPAYAADVEYDQLRELLTAGNTSLRNSSYYTSLDRLQYQIDVLDEEVDNMLQLKSVYADEDISAEGYAQSAHQMAKTLKQLRKRLSTMTNGHQSIDSMTDSLLMTAQTRMISVKQLEYNLAAAEKSVEAAQKSYDNTLLRFTVGRATAADTDNAFNTLLSRRNEYESTKQRYEAQRRQLLTMLGLSEDAAVTIGEIPAPDVDTIRALSLEEDLETAVNNDASVQQIRHRSSDSSYAMQQKENQEAEAVGNATAEFTDTYNQLMTGLQEYEAAGLFFQAAQQAYEGLGRKAAAGMLTEADRLAGEASYLSAKTQYETASMRLFQAYESYQWQKKGVA